LTYFEENCRFDLEINDKAKPGRAVDVPNSRRAAEPGPLDSLEVMNSGEGQTDADSRPMA
jgi:hypothetical protein